MEKYIKIAIVGASENKWPKEKIPVVRQKIEQILSTKPTQRFPEINDYIPFNDIILVSGGCPKGEFRWYCHDDNRWLAKDESPEKEHLWEGHKVLQYYFEGGVDTLAEISADREGIQKDIKRPEVHQWHNRTISWSQREECTNIIHGDDRDGFAHRHFGYQTRNIQIAEACDILYCISPKCLDVDKHDEYGNMLDSVTKNPIVVQDKNGSSWLPICQKCKGSGVVWNGGRFTLFYLQKNFPQKKGIEVVI